MSESYVRSLGVLLVAAFISACGGGGGGGGGGAPGTTGGSSSSSAVSASSSSVSSSAASSVGTSSSSSSSSLSSSSSGAVINVTNAAELVSALAAVNPGETIQLAAGTYVGTFVANRTGTVSQPITLKGPSTAILQNDAATSKHYGLYMSAVNYWVVDGFTVTNSQKGIVTDQSNFNILKNLTVHDVQDEGVHFRQSSSDNIIQNSTIYNTGLVQPDFGEGVYLGSAKSNWASIMGNANTPDPSHRNTVLNNTIGPNVSAEGIDVKEGTNSGLIKGNTFIATGISGQNSGDSVIDMKGDNYTVDGNIVTNTPTGPSNCAQGDPARDTKNCFKDGFQIHLNTVNSISYGNNNTFSHNTINLNTTGPEGAIGYIALAPGSGQGWGVTVQSGITGTVVCTNNTVLNAISTRGLSNIATAVCP
ncbi:MAG: hypothetical protein JWL63_688 [Rhodocyclales bacterium]|nr:hypothetical protein [Rhodocyclales bacterium]